MQQNWYLQLSKFVLNLLFHLDELYDFLIDLNDKIVTCMSTIMDGVCRPLNVRLEQTILSGLDCPVMNKIDMCIKFYVETIEQVFDLIRMRILLILHR